MRTGCVLLLLALVSDETKRDGPLYIPPEPVLLKAIELAKVKKTDRVYDVVGGDARFAVAAARHVGAKGVATGNDRIFDEDAGENVATHKVKDLVTLLKHDFFKHDLDLSKADVIWFNPLPSLQKTNLERFKGVPAGTRLMTYLFPLKGVKPTRQVTVRTGESEWTVYLYVAPLKVTDRDGK
jgi:hypothetical protein